MLLSLLYVILMILLRLGLFMCYSLLFVVILCFYLGYEVVIGNIVMICKCSGYVSIGCGYVVCFMFCNCFL